jgi:hypothetical protein
MRRLVESDRQNVPLRAGESPRHRRFPRYHRHNRCNRISQSRRFVETV